MVSITDNRYQLRDFLFEKALHDAKKDAFKLSLMYILKLDEKCSIEFIELNLYQKCTLAGILDSNPVSISDLSRLLGQAPKVESTPRPWFSDVFGVASIKWLVDSINNESLLIEFKTWKDLFLNQSSDLSRFNLFELDIISYINAVTVQKFQTACIPLFLHYFNKKPIYDQKKRSILIEKFMDEFQKLGRCYPSSPLLYIMIYVFDQASKDLTLLPPNGWSFKDLCNYLEEIDKSLRRWTWEEKPRTKNADIIKWYINNEYHVQNLLYTLLAPIFTKIGDEIYLPPVGQKTPRIDLYLPSIHTIIEVKYRKDSKKNFQSFIDEIGADAAIYRASTEYRDAKIAVFLWDNTRSVQEHSKFKEGILKLEGIDGCIVANAPSMMN